MAFSGITGSAVPIALHVCKSLPAEQASHALEGHGHKG